MSAGRWEFQYISCYGLSYQFPGNWFTIDHFNTSHVTVYHTYLINAYHVHTHFNTSHVTVYLDNHPLENMHDTFQYISCYGLSIWQITIKGLLLNFNTSHVTVYQLLFLLSLLFLQDFNTSHVTVYHHLRNVRMQSRSYFNTSHVTVYQVSAAMKAVGISHFNTSHVTVYLHVIMLIWDIS